MHMHIHRQDSPGLGFVAWCGVEVDGFTRSYMTVDNALKALRAKRGTPCQECLQRIIDVLQQGIEVNNKEKEEKGQ
jgi:hypothetical protein